MTKRNLTQGAIVQAMAELLGNKPIEQITMEDIAHGAGVSVRTVYNHFADKYAIVAYLLTELYEARWHDEAGNLVTFLEFHRNFMRDMPVTYLDLFSQAGGDYLSASSLWQTSFDLHYNALIRRIEANGHAIDALTEMAVRMYAHAVTGLQRDIFVSHYRTHDERFQFPLESADASLQDYEITLMPDHLKPLLLD